MESISPVTPAELLQSYFNAKREVEQSLNHQIAIPLSDDMLDRIRNRENKGILTLCFSAVEFATVDVNKYPHSISYSDKLFYPFCATSVNADLLNDITYSRITIDFNGYTFCIQESTNVLLTSQSPYIVVYQTWDGSLDCFMVLSGAVGRASL